jgi:hypothetical protein
LLGGKLLPLDPHLINELADMSEEEIQSRTGGEIGLDE